MFAVLDELEMAIDKVAAYEGTVDVEQISRLCERVEFLRVAAVGAYDRSGVWELDGYQSAAAGLRATCRVEHGAAQGTVRLARRLEELPEVSAAFAAGSISREHARVIARAWSPERAAMLAGIEADLVALARLTGPGRLRSKVREMTDAFDGDGGASDDKAHDAKNRLTFDATLDGRFEPHGSFDPESGDIIATALAAEMAVLRATHDERPAPQRRAEALTSICRWYLAQTDDGTQRRRGQPHLNVICDLNALQGITPSVFDTIRAEAAHASRLSRTTLERIACDCKLSRILMDGDSQVLDVGRITRTIPTPLWNALVARDKHCTHPGCDRPPSLCEAHQIIYWTQGGATNLENLKLLCWYHHRQQHQHDATHSRT